MNPSLFAQHPWAFCFAAFLAGMFIKWLLDLFFLRAQFDQTQQDLSRREREFQDLRFQFNKTQTEFRSKSDLLAAVQKSKAAVDAELQVTGAERTGLRQQLAGAVSTANGYQRELSHGQARLASLEAEHHDQQSRIQSATLETATLAAELKTAQSATQELRERNRQLEAEHDLFQQSIRGFESDADARQSVVSTLEAAVLARDRTLAELKPSAAAANQKRSAALTALADKDKELAHLRSQLESAHRIRATAESTAGRLESELTHARTRMGELAGEFQELEAELKAATHANESLTEQLRLVPTAADSAPAAGPRESEAALIADLETVSRERNELAAELAALKAAAPPPPARRSSPKTAAGRIRGDLTQTTLLPDEAPPLGEDS